jgi:hypothetical protein
MCVHPDAMKAFIAEPRQRNLLKLEGAVPVKRRTAAAVMILAFASLGFGQKHQARSYVLSLVGDKHSALVQADKNALKETLVGLEKQSWEAWKKRDGKFFQEFLADDHVEVGLSGTATKAQIVAFVGSSLCVVRSYRVDKFELTLFDAKTALLTYYAEQDTTCNGTAVTSPAWASSLYIKRGGRWLNALYQQTPTNRT